MTITSCDDDSLLERAAVREHSLDVVLDLCGASFDDRRLRDEDDPNVTINPFFGDTAGALPQEPLRSVSFYRAADFAAGDDTDSDPVRRFRAMEKNDGVSCDELGAAVVTAPKLPCMRQGSRASPGPTGRVPAVCARRMIGRAHDRGTTQRCACAPSHDGA